MDLSPSTTKNDLIKLKDIDIPCGFAHSEKITLPRMRCTNAVPPPSMPTPRTFIRGVVDGAKDDLISRSRDFKDALALEKLMSLQGRKEEAKSARNLAMKIGNSEYRDAAVYGETPGSIYEDNLMKESTRRLPTRPIWDEKAIVGWEKSVALNEAFSRAASEMAESGGLEAVHVHVEEREIQEEDRMSSDHPRLFESSIL